MEITLSRKTNEQDASLGFMAVDGKFFCFTLEDLVRDLKEDGSGKLYGKTAIPAGRYKLTITMSPKFGKPMILVNDVLWFTGIRIHSGNDSEDTDGCVLVGLSVDAPNHIHGGSVVLPQLFDIVKKELDAGNEVWFTVTNDFTGGLK
jgi:hypothetical protein